MRASDPRSWMWAEAIEMLARAQRMQRQMFEPRQSARAPNWEPPADVIETEDAVLVLTALPGVDPAEVHAMIEDGVLVIAGQRVPPEELRTAVVIHRLELPQGRFERHIPLPAGRYDAVLRSSVNGCLLIKLRKLA